MSRSRRSSLAAALIASALLAPLTVHADLALILEEWVWHVDGEQGAAALSPDGSRLFAVTADGADHVTVASDAVTGAPQWEARYAGALDSGASAGALVVANDGARVFVTGSVDGPASDIITIAYDALTGEQLWSARYDGGGGRSDHAGAMAISSDGTRLFVTGGTSHDFGVLRVVLAYEADTGEQLWFAGGGPLSGGGAAIAVGRQDAVVYVTSAEGSGTYDMMTTAYDAVTGGPIWGASHDGPTGGAGDIPRAMSLSPDGTRLYVAGSSYFFEFSGVSGRLVGRFAAVAYEATTGRRLWSRVLLEGRNGATDLVVAPDGERIYLTGDAFGRSDGLTGSDHHTVALDADTGVGAWTIQTFAPGQDFARAIAVSPDGSQVYVTGDRELLTRDMTTAAHDAQTGAPLWHATFANAYGMAIVADDERVLAAGRSSDEDGSPVGVLLAYCALRASSACLP